MSLNGNNGNVDFNVHDYNMDIIYYIAIGFY